jgi:serine/threonine protein kinase
MKNTMIAKGGYGCIYYPGFKCNGSESKDKTLISKIQNDNFTGKNEGDISRTIKKIRGYRDRFRIIESSCVLELKKISSKKIEECDILKKTVILSKMEYVKHKNIFLMLMNEKNTDLIGKKVYSVIYSYLYIVESIQKLGEIGVIHFDLKPDNILYDERRELPIIIDYGISINMNILDESLYKKYFYVYFPQYYVWCIEIHYICYLLHVNTSPSKNDIREICETCISNNYALRLLSPKFIKKYTKMCVDYYLSFQGKKYRDVIKTLLKTSNTWDNYSISLIYMTGIEYIYFLNFEKNQFVIKLMQLLVQNIHPNPTKRTTVSATLNTARKLFNGIDFNTKNMENIKENVVLNSKEIETISKLDSERSVQLSRQISV